MVRRAVSKPSSEFTKENPVLETARRRKLKLKYLGLYWKTCTYRGGVNGHIYSPVRIQYSSLGTRFEWSQLFKFGYGDVQIRIGDPVGRQAPLDHV